jgi:hypothetical protein
MQKNKDNMAPGDAQRVWFPEMIATLKSHWSSSVTWEELAIICRTMSKKREEIRKTRGIKPPKTKCRKCGSISGGSNNYLISIRSALFVLKNSDVITEEEFKKLDKEWKKYKKENNLDPYGHPILSLN